jgi:hypothetical protein
MQLLSHDDDHDRNSPVRSLEPIVELVGFRHCEVAH